MNLFKEKNTHTDRHWSNMVVKGSRKTLILQIKKMSNSWMNTLGRYVDEKSR